MSILRGYPQQTYLLIKCEPTYDLHSHRGMGLSPQLSSSSHPQRHSSLLQRYGLDSSRPSIRRPNTLHTRDDGQMMVKKVQLLSTQHFKKYASACAHTSLFKMWPKTPSSIQVLSCLTRACLAAVELPTKWDGGEPTVLLEPWLAVERRTENPRRIKMVWLQSLTCWIAHKTIVANRQDRWGSSWQPKWTPGSRGSRTTNWPVTNKGGHWSQLKPGSLVEIEQLMMSLLRVASYIALVWRETAVKTAN